MCALMAAALLGSTFSGQLPLSEDLAKVPGNALGFVHVRVDDLTKSPAFKLYHDLLPKAGPDALALLERRIEPSPLAIDRVTVVVMLPQPGSNDPEVMALIHVAKPLDVKTLTAGLEGANGVYRLRGNHALQILGKQTFAIEIIRSEDLDD
ncbi:MAG: hypothetical protein WCL32_14650 [Planctomycetota bacterium]